MIELAANTYHFDKSAAEDYLSDYSDEELRDLLKKQMEKLVCENMPSRRKRRYYKSRQPPQTRTICSAHRAMPLLPSRLTR